jgi:hypothetical protein
MEHGTTIATMLAYGCIVVFLVVICAALLRSLLRPLVLVALQLARRSRDRGEAMPSGDDAHE